MRPWIEAILLNSTAHDDFLKYIEGIRTAQITKIIEESTKGNSSQVIALGIELGVYERLRSAISASFRELQSQTERSNKK